jgi:hypothetical protein
MRTLLTNATLIDCVQPQPIQGTRVLIEDGRIREICNDGSEIHVGDALEIDLRGGYLMPGLWDAHIHPDYYSLSDMPLADQVTLFGHRLMAALTESGIVGLRCAGAHSYMDVAWKRAFDSGQYVGPRVFAAGPGCVRTVLSAARARCRVGFAVRLGGREASEARRPDQRFPLSLDRLQQWSAAQNRYYAFHVVGEHIKRHLGCYLVSSPHQEVRRTHPVLYGPERMLCRLAA